MDEHGREPGEVEFYRMTHIHHDGTFVRDESRHLYERATTLVAERVDDSAPSMQNSRIEAEVFTELMGPERYGRVKGYGVGVTPTQLSEVSRYMRDAADGAQDERVRRLEQRIEEMRQRHVDDRAAMMEEMRRSRADDRAAMMEEMRRSRTDDRAAMDSMREHIERLTSIVQIFVPHQATGASHPRGRSDDLPPADH